MAIKNFGFENRTRLIFLLFENTILFDFLKQFHITRMLFWKLRKWCFSVNQNTKAILITGSISDGSEKSGFWKKNSSNCSFFWSKTPIFWLLDTVSHCKNTFSETVWMMFFSWLNTKINLITDKISDGNEKYGFWEKELV